MCNLYAMTRTQDEVRRVFGVDTDEAGNVPPLDGIYPDNMAPIIRRTAAGGRDLVRARWGLPSPPSVLRPGQIDRGVTNVRNLRSPHWRRLLAPQYRCLVPATSFCEPTDAPDPSTGRKRWVWFALEDDHPLFAFAGLWCDWRGVRGTKAIPVEGEHRLYGFLTTEPNATVSAVHSKAMPVILRAAHEWERWLAASVEEAVTMQRPLPTEAVQVVLASTR